MGMKGSSTVNLTLEDMRVPKENLLGKPGEGGNIALNILNIGRFKLGAADLGACKFCIDAAAQYAQQRRQFGQPIAWFQAVRKKFADMVVRTYMLDSVIYRTVGLMDERIASLDTADPGYNEQVMAALEEYAIEASISKILGSESLFRISDHGIQIFGGYGYSEEYPMARVFRNSRIDRIWEGTNEINRMVIYGYYLKKALMEELPLRDAEKEWDADGSSNGDGSLRLGGRGSRRLAPAHREMPVRGDIPLRPGPAPPASGWGGPGRSGHRVLCRLLRDQPPASARRWGTSRSGLSRSGAVGDGHLSRGRLAALLPAASDVVLG